MVVQLVVTPAMIKCFHECAEDGSYLQLFEEYEEFFESLKENLDKVKFSEPLYSAIIKESELLLNCLTTWVPNTALPWAKETVNTDLYLLGFLPRFVLAMQTRNWNDFYKQFLPIIDLLIEAARRQEVIDLKIGLGSEIYDTVIGGYSKIFFTSVFQFYLRDEAVSPQEAQNHCSVICTSGHSSLFDCDSKCRRFLRSLYGSKRINRKNAEKLVLTEKMISCFHECAEKRDFKKLFEEYSAFFDILLDELGKVNPNTDSLSTFLFKNSKILFGYLTKWDPNESLPWDNDSIRIESRYSGLIPHLHIAMVIQDWDDFYQHHRKTADMLIREARVQELIDLKIEYKGNLFDNFEARDAPEQRHFSSFIRKYGTNRHYSLMLPGKRPPKNFLSTGSTASKNAKHVTFAEPDAKNSEGVITEIPIKLIPARVPEVKKTILTEIPEVKESSSNSVAEAKHTVPTETPKVEELGSNRLPEVKETPEMPPCPKTDGLQVSQTEEISRLESRIQRLLAKQLDLIRVETDRKHKNLETRINFLEENLKSVEINQKTFDQKLHQMESRFEISMETKLKEFGKNLTSKISQNENEDSTKKLELLEEKLQFRELILHQKIDEIKIREQTLDNRMNVLMELLESKRDNSEEKKLPGKLPDDSPNPEKKKTLDQTLEDIDFDRKLAEQLLDYEERLRRIQKKRKEMNKDS